MHNLIPDIIARNLRDHHYKGSLHASVLFFDLAGFTTLTEALMRSGSKGSETLNEIINRIFTPLILNVYKAGGFIASFSGDAFTAVFPDHPECDPYKTARKCSDELNKLGLIKTNAGVFDIASRMGLAHGTVQWIIFGEGRLSYCFYGAPLAAAAKSSVAGRKNTISLHLSFEDYAKERKDIKSASELPLVSHSNRNALSISLLKRFVPPVLLEMSFGGEFRDVLTVFIQFNETNPERLVKDSSFQLMLTAEHYGGYFGGLFYDDKGLYAMVVFGAPVAHENETERALRYLSQVRTAFAARIKAGVSYGKVFAGFVGSRKRSTYTVMGDSVNIAARLMSVTSWDSIWVDERTAKTGVDLVESLPVGNLPLKGKTQELPTWSLGGLKAETIRKYSGRFIGRRDELSRLTAFLSPLSQNRFAGIAYIYGEPGVGKTRLVNELVTEDKNGISVIWLTNDDVLSKSLSPFNDYLRGLFGITEDETGDGFEAFNAGWKSFISSLNDGLSNKPIMGSLIEELESFKPFLASLIGIHSEDVAFRNMGAESRFRKTIYAIKTVFKALSLIKPLFLVLEDLQWLDEDSQQFFTIFCRNIETFPIALVVTSRLFDDGSYPKLRVTASVNQFSIDLSQLADVDARSLIEQRMASSVTPQLKELIISQAGGNPFFLEQYCLFLKENDLLLVNENGMLGIKEDIPALPEGVRSVLIARLDRLGLKLRELVQSAAVLGREFDIRILSGMLGGQSIQPLLLEGEHYAIWEVATEYLYLFQHALLVDVAYEMQLQKRLQKLHYLAARALQALHGEDDFHLMTLAYHYGRAGRMRNELLLLRKALDVALKEYRNNDILEILKRLVLIEPNNLKRISYRIKLGKVYYVMGKRELSLNIREENLELARKLKSNRFLQSSLTEKAHSEMLVGHLDVSISLVEEACRVARKTRKNVEIASTLSFYAQLLQMTGQLEKAEKVLNEILIMAEGSQMNEIKAKVLCNIAIGLAMKGDMTNALDYFTRFYELCHKCGFLQDEAVALVNIAMVYMNNKNHDLALEYYKRNLELVKRIGYTVQLANTYHSMGVLYSVLREMEEAATYLVLALETARETGLKEIEIGSLNSLASVCMEQGRLDEAMTWVVAALAAGKDTGFAHQMANAHSTRALLLWLDNSDIVPVTDLTQAIDYVRQSKDHDVVKKSFSVSVRILLDKSLINEAMPLLEEWSSIISQGEQTDELSDLMCFKKIAEAIKGSTKLDELRSFASRVKPEMRGLLLWQIWRISHSQSDRESAINVFHELESTQPSYINRWYLMRLNQ